MPSNLLNICSIGFRNRVMDRLDFLALDLLKKQLGKLTVALCASFIFAGTASAGFWKSSDFNCQVNLPEGEPITGGTRWTAVGSTQEGTLVGAMRVDGTAYVFLGYVDIAKRPKFHLNEKTIEELEKRFFGPGLGFRRTIERVSLRGMWGYRLTGDSVYHGGHFGLVVDMYEAGGLIYELAGMKEYDQHPLRDPDIKGYLESFVFLH
jgi:hypothetical protein